MAWLKLIFLIVFFGGTLIIQAQTFEVGLVGHQPNIIKLLGKIVITDSLVTTSFNGKESSQKIVNKTDVKIYTTDGTATNLYSVVQLTGKIKSFAYDYIITYTPDQRFNVGGVGNFFCKKIN